MFANRIRSHLQSVESRLAMEMRHAEAMANAIERACPDILCVSACTNLETGEVRLCWGLSIDFVPIERDDLFGAAYIIAERLRELAPVLADIARVVEGGAA